MRRLPVYLLLDISGSMRGEPIEAVNNGVKTLVDTLRCNPYALETVYLSLIPFNNVVEQAVPLTELCLFQAPILEARFGTYLGKAIKYLSTTAESEVVKTTREVKGDWKPLVFIMSDGRSGDKIEKALLEFNKEQFGCIVACATGPKPNIEALKLITDNVIQISNVNTETLQTYFKWITASVASSSAKVDESNSEVAIMEDLPPLPTGINLVK